MKVTCELSGYDLLQQGISTADALSQLGAGERQAAIEAAETVTDELETPVSEAAYVIEWIVSTGPQVDYEFVKSQMSEKSEDRSLKEYLDSLLTSVIAGAILTETSQTSPSETFSDRPEPKQTYDPQPDKIISMFLSQARQSERDDSEKSARIAVNSHRRKLSELSFTSHCIVIQYLTTEYEHTFSVSGHLDPDLTEIAIELFIECLAEIIRDMSSSGSS